MRISRLYLATEYGENQHLELSKEQAHYALTVLRLKNATILEIFNGQGTVARGTLEVTGRRTANIIIDSVKAVDVESPIKTTLVQGISRGDRMDQSIQKSVELGISAIQPVFTERCEVKLQGDKLEKRRQQWQTIAINACEQSGRNVVPEILPILNLPDWLKDHGQESLSLILDPTAEQSLIGIQKPDKNTAIHFIIGPEGGLSEDEVELAINSGCQSVKLGPRVLRTETAGPAVLAIVQALWGDLS